MSIYLIIRRTCAIYAMDCLAYDAVSLFYKKNVKKAIFFI